ncbi:8407_t:CDS:2, partial [Gigaspora margarita]
MRWLTLNLPNTPFTRVYYSAVLKDSRILYIGGSGVNTLDMNETTRGDQVGSRYGHSAVLIQDGLILIYGGLGPNDTQVQPDVATLDVSVTPYVWKAIVTNNAPPQPLTYHSATLYGIYMIIAF